MKRTLLAVYSILLLLSLSAFADTADVQPSQPVETQPLSPAGESLQQDLLAAVKTFDRSVQMYHYFRAPADPNNSQQINPYLQDKANRDSWLSYFSGFRTGAFWDPNNHVTELTNSGPGMYFAIDPNVSKNFGESAIVLNVPAGLKYLSVFKNISIRKQTCDFLIKENIIAKSQLNSGEKTLGLSRGFTGNTLKNMAREENGEFRKLVNSIFDRNRIMFTEYEWKSHLAGFCKTASQSAFVFVGLKPNSAAASTETTTAITEIKSEDASEVLGHIPEELNNAFLFTDFAVENLSESELREKDVLGRFRNALAKIRDKGLTKAQKYINENLNDEEFTELADKSYRCERRY